MDFKHIIILLTVIFLSCCKSDYNKSVEKNDYLIPIKNLLKQEATGELFAYALTSKNLREDYSEVICKLLNEKPDQELHNIISTVNDTSYISFAAFPNDQINFCYSGTFYIKAENLDSIVQYNEEFNYSSRELINRIKLVAEYSQMPLEELIKYKSSRLNGIQYWNPKLMFFIILDYRECSEKALEQVSKALDLIHSNLDSITTELFGEAIPLNPRIIIKNVS